MRPVRKSGGIVAAALAASAVFALLMLAGLASRGLAASQALAGGLAPAQHSGQSPAIIIDSISSSGFARPGATVKVSGQFRSGTTALPQGLDVQLRSSGSPFTARSQLDGFAAGSYQPDSVPIATVPLPANVSPGQTVIWHASFNVDQVGMHAAFVNVYPLVAGVYDPAGTQIAAERTFLPFWSGTDRVGQPVRVAWVWPLIDQPHRGMCPAMLDNSLAASLDNGRLSDLLNVGRDYASSAKLTWAVDPALLDDANAMTHSYQVLDGPECSQAGSQPASGAARSWLATLRAVTAGQPAFATPYADPDVAALTHQGLDADLAAAFSDGSAVAAEFLGRPERTIAWPPDGIADAGVVDNLLVQGGSAHSGSVHGGIQTVVLDSGMMPPTNPSLYYTPDAVAQVNTGVGKTVRVLLADHELTTVLAAGSPVASQPGAGSPAASSPLASQSTVGSPAASQPATSSPAASQPTADSPAASSTATGQSTASSPAAGSPAADSVTAISQRFLAETAMIAAEAPNLRRSVVVAPPRRWNPSAPLASRLLSDTVSAPWISAAYLSSLKPITTPQGIPGPDRALLPQNQPGPGLTPRYLDEVRDLGEATRLFESILSQPGAAYRLGIARLESSAWGGSGQAQGDDLLRQADVYIGSQQRMVKIIPSSEVALGGSRGTVPVSIENKLQQAVQVRLQAAVLASREVPASTRLTMGTPPAQVITIGPRLKQTIRLQVRAHSVGVSEIRLGLLTPAGAPLPDSNRTLKIRATAFGTLALVIVAVALGVLVITFAARVLRSGMREGRPGSVRAEDDRTDDNGSADARDELADARGRARPDARQ